MQSGTQVRMVWSGRPFTATVHDTWGRSLGFFDGRGGEAVWEASKEKKGVYLIRVHADGEKAANRVVVY